MVERWRGPDLLGFWRTGYDGKLERWKDGKLEHWKKMKKSMGWKDAEIEKWRD
jgi:hypothetical protein